VELSARLVSAKLLKSLTVYATSLLAEEVKEGKMEAESGMAFGERSAS
jgi:hypothetical protein